MSLHPKIRPKSTAILAMDFQGSILGFLPDAAPLLAGVGGAIRALRDRGATIGFVRVGFTDAEVAAFPSHSAMGQRIKAAGPNMHADSPRTAVHEALAPRPSDIVVRKTRVGAFSTTDLHRQLRSAGIETLVLAGVHTSGVVLSTAREAHDLDYRVIVLSDGCADPDPDIHALLVGKILSRQATVMTIGQFVELLSDASDTP